MYVLEPPEPPSSLYVTELGSRSLTLSWYPAFDGNSPVLHYLVQYKRKNQPWRSVYLLKIPASSKIVGKIRGRDQR